MYKKAFMPRSLRLPSTLVFLAALALPGASGAQTLTTVTGTIKDLAQTIVSTGKVVFTLMPGIDTTISGTAIFPSSQTTCTINQSTSFTASGLARRSAQSIVTVSFTATHTFIVGDVITVSFMGDPSFNGTFTVTAVPNSLSIAYSQQGPNATTGGGVIAALRKVPGPGSCGLTFNTAISPSGTYYNACIWPGNVKSSCFNMYAVSPALDITTVVPTPATAPAYNFLDSFSNQSIAGNKTFSGTTTFSGPTAGLTVAPSIYNFGSLPASAASGQVAYLTDRWRGPVVFNGTKWRPINGQQVNLSDFAKGDIKGLSGCSVTSGSYVVTCGGPFVAGDVGKLIVIFFAKKNGYGTNPTATTTLSGGAITTPTVTSGGSTYLNAPVATITGLTCTAGQPEIQPVLTADVVTSITVVFAGSGCTGAPVVAMGPSFVLPWEGVISAVTNSTTVTTTSNMGAPDYTLGGTTGYYGSDDGAAINAAINALASDSSLNPLMIFCDHAFITSTTINVVDKSVYWNGIPGGSLGFGATSTPQEGCEIIYTGGANTDAMYIAGNSFSEFHGIHIRGVSGHKARAGIRLQQPAAGPGSYHNNQYNLFTNIQIGPTYGGDIDQQKSPNGEFQYGIFTDIPASNNDQMIFSSIWALGEDIGFYNYSNQSTELLLDGYRGDFLGTCISVNSTVTVRSVDCSNGVGTDIVLGNPDVSANISLDLTQFTSENGHQFMKTAGIVSTSSVQLHGSISVQPADTWIHSGAQVDLSAGGVALVVSDTDISFTPPFIAGCSVCAPLHYVYGDGQAKRSWVVNGHGNYYNQMSVANALGGAGGSYAAGTQQNYVKKFFDTGLFGVGQEIETEMVLNGVTDPTAEPNHRDILGKAHVIGALQVDKLAMPSNGYCGVGNGGGGATNYYYKFTALVNGKESTATPEIACTGAATLNSSNQMIACIPAVVGAQQYKLYGRTAMGTEGLIKTFSADNIQQWNNNFFGGYADKFCTFDDGTGAPGASPPTVDNTGKILLGNSGPSWASGGFAPSGACTNGSLFSRTDTGTLYVCQAAAWVGGAGSFDPASPGPIGGTTPSTIGSTVLTFTKQNAPANPPAGKDVIYADLISGNLTCLTSAGTSCFPSGGGAGGSVPTGTGFTHNTGGAQDAASVAETGTGSVVRATSPSMVTPTITGNITLSNGGNSMYVLADGAIILESGAGNNLVLGGNGGVQWNVPDNVGSVVPRVDNTYDLGSATNRVQHGWFNFIQHEVGTVAGLPACNAAAEGTHYGVTDALAPTFHSVIAGGGAVHTPVYCNGTNWIAE